MPLDRRGAILVALALLGCGLHEVPGPPGVEQIVVQGVLNAQTAEQVLWIERSVPAGDPIVDQLRPLATPPARVEVRDSAGTVYPFQGDTASPIRFVAAFTPTPGARYDLLVEAGGDVLTANTRVPPALTIVDPPTDTIAWPRDSAVPVTWAGPIRGVRAAMGDTTGVQLVAVQWVHADTSVALRAFSSFPSVGFWVVAFDSVTTRIGDPFFGLGGLSRRFRGNVRGGVGLFGAAAGDHIIVRLQ